MYKKSWQGIHPPRLYDGWQEKTSRDEFDRYRFDYSLERMVEEENFKKSVNKELDELLLKLQELEKKVLDYQTDSKMNDKREIKWKH